MRCFGLRVAGGGAALCLLLSVPVRAADPGLIEAVKAGDRTRVEALVKGGADVTASEPDGATALAWAVHRDNVEIAALLIRAGAPANAANHYGVTPLSLACSNRNEAMVALLLKAGANPNASASTGEAPLLTAARTGSVGIVKQLLAHGADVTATESRRQQTPLMWALAGNHPEVVRVLIEGGSAVEAASTTGFTPLMFAARQGSVNMARMLVDAGADVNRTAQDGTTALFVAAASLAPSNKGHQDVGALLLERGARIAVDGVPHTALHAAVWSGKPELVQALLASGADSNARVTAAKRDGGGGIRLPRGATPFWLAAKKVEPQLMRMLVAAGADPAITPDDGTTALMSAAGVGQVEGPRARNAFLSTYRSDWDEARALEAVEYLMSLGADINAVNKSKGWNALHGAAHIGADRMVEWLVRHGATVDVRDKIGQTAWSLATEGARDQLTRTPHPSTAELLRKFGATPESSR